MIVVDSSALVAILRKEPEAAALLERLAADSGPCVCAATVLETSIVLRSLDRPSGAQADLTLDEFLAATGIEVVPFTRELADIARVANASFGKGSGHPAQLNFGDCFSYALAKSLGVPLLFKGQDFARTDIARAI